MIKFIHKKHAEAARGSAKIIITYTLFELVLGVSLLLTNVSAMILIYKFILYPENPRSYIRIGSSIPMGVQQTATPNAIPQMHQ